MEVELESDKEGEFTISCLSLLTGTTVSGLKYLSTNSHYRGVRVEDGELFEPNDGWQSESRSFGTARIWKRTASRILVASNQHLIRMQSPVAMLFLMSEDIKVRTFI